MNFVCIGLLLAWTAIARAAVNEIQHVIDNIYIGDRISIRNYDPLYLNSFGIDRIIVVAHEDELSIPEQFNCVPSLCPFKFLRIPIADNGLEPLGTYLSEAFEFIQYSRVSSCKDCQSNVLIHCSEGRSRSPALIISYLIASKRFNLYESYNLLKKIRPIIQPRYQLFEELLELERFYFGKNSMSHSDNYVPIILHP